MIEFLSRNFENLSQSALLQLFLFYNAVACDVKFLKDVISSNRMTSWSEPVTAFSSIDLFVIAFSIIEYSSQKPTPKTSVPYILIY